MYVIQYKQKPWQNKWVAGKKRYPTLAEVQAAYNKQILKADTRIAEEYTQIRYKPVNTHKK